MTELIKLKKGKTDYRVLKDGWNVQAADENYILIYWLANITHPQGGFWQHTGNGNKEWAERTAKHYGVKVEDLKKK